MASAAGPQIDGYYSRGGGPPLHGKKNNTYLDIRHPRSMKIYSTGVDTAWKATKNKILFDTICATPQIFPTNHHTPKYFKGVETAPQTSRIEN